MQDTRLDKLPEPLQDAYLLFWSGRRGRATRSAGLHGVEELLRATEIYEDGDDPDEVPKPLLELDANELDAAMLDTIRCDDQLFFKQLLACAFHLTWAEDEWLPGFIGLYPWREWPPDEQEVVEAALMFLWRHGIQNGRAGAVDAVSRAARKLKLSLVPFFEAWFSSGASAWMLWLAVDQFDERWLKPSDESRWLCRPQVLARVEADFFNASGAEAEEISRLHDFLRWLCEK